MENYEARLVIDLHPEAESPASQLLELEIALRTYSWLLLNF